MKKPVEAYKKSLSLRSDDVYTHGNLGLAYINLKRYTEGIEALKQAIRLDPNWLDHTSTLGLGYHFAGRRDEAMQQHKILQTLDLELAKQLLERISK